MGEYRLTRDGSVMGGGVTSKHEPTRVQADGGGGGGVSCVKCTEAHVVLRTLLLEDHGSAGREP